MAGPNRCLCGGKVTIEVIQAKTRPYSWNVFCEHSPIPRAVYYGTWLDAMRQWNDRFNPKETPNETD
jgi:hypothetical protein